MEKEEGRKEHIYLTIRQCTIHIKNNRIVMRLSLRLNKAASATATEIIIIFNLYRIIIIINHMELSPQWCRCNVIFLENHLKVSVIFGEQESLFNPIISDL